MNHERLLVEKYRQALQELAIAQNHFKYCGTTYIDCAIDDLNNAEKNVRQILKELRYGSLDETISKNKES